MSTFSGTSTIKSGSIVLSVNLNADKENPPGTLETNKFDNIGLIQETSEKLKEKGVTIVSVLDKIDTREPLGNFFLIVLGWIAENDFFSIKERQRAGVEERKVKCRWADQRGCQQKEI